MKKASNILFLIGGIVAILMVILWLVLSIVFFVYGGTAALIAAGEGSNLDPNLVDALQLWMRQNGYVKNYIYQYEAASAACIGYGVTLLFMSLFAVPAAILCFICRKKEPSLGLLITTGVFNLLGGAAVGLAGAVVGIVDWAVNGKK